MGLTLKEVSKSFGTNKAVDKVSLTLDTPGVYGLLGTNGAGKTTIIRMLLGIINNDSGEITWNDKKVSREAVNFGYLPEERGVYQKIKIRNQLMYFGELKGMKKEDIIASIDKWSKKLKVEQYMNMTADKLSKGNQQKIQFMIAILHNPELVVLDEPFSGLDPVNVGKLKEIITEFIKKDKLVIFSSHQMPVVETFCEDINILEQGEIVLSGNLDYIKKQLGHGKMILSVSNLEKEELLANLKSIPMGIEYSLVPEGVLLDFKEEGAKKELLAKLSGSSFNVEEFKLYKPSLEEIFVSQVGK